jgi:hypothetical protein
LLELIQDILLDYQKEKKWAANLAALLVER